MVGETQEYREEIEKNIRIYESDVEYHTKKIQGLKTMLRVSKDLLNKLPK